MIRNLLNLNGSIICKLSGSSEMVGLNTPSNAVYVDDVEPISPTDYWDFNLQQFISIGDPPSLQHVFDYNTKQWIDPRFLYEIKFQKWDEIKAERDRLEFGGFEYKGNVYDSDQVSQGRIMGATIAGVDQVWTLANNTTVNLTGDELKEVYAALQEHVAAVHERGRLARFNIDVAMTPQEVEAVTL